MQTSQLSSFSTLPRAGLGPHLPLAARGHAREHIHGLDARVGQGGLGGADLPRALDAAAAAARVGAPYTPLAAPRGGPPPAREAQSARGRVRGSVEPAQSEHSDWTSSDMRAVLAIVVN